MGQTTEKMDKVRDKNQNKDKNLNIDGNLNTDGNMNKAKGESSDKDCTMEEAFARLNDILGQLDAGGQSLAMPRGWRWCVCAMKKLTG